MVLTDSSLESGRSRTARMYKCDLLVSTSEHSRSYFTATAATIHRLVYQRMTAQEVPQTKEIALNMERDKSTAAAEENVVHPHTLFLTFSPPYQWP